MKTAKSNPELIVEGTKCKILLPSKWIGAQTTEPNVWLPAKIKMIYKDKDNPSEISAITVDVRASHKYKTIRVENMMSSKTQFDTIRF